MTTQYKRLLAPSRLSQPQVDNLLQTSDFRFTQQQDGLWKLDTAIKRLEIDLSLVRRADIKALAQLATAIVAAADDLELIRIVPPTDARVRSFIDYTKFATCLQAAPNVSYSVESDLPNPPASTYMSVMPLTWLTDAHSYESFLKNFLRQPAANVSISAHDGGDLANIILTEFFDNVRQHSGAPGALVAAWSQRDARYPDSGFYYKEELPYYDSLSEDRVGQLHLHISDCGVGIPFTLGSLFPDSDRLSVLDHAFDRWSSSVDRSDTRGTRGLYRVDRVVRRNRGLATIRSGREIAGRCYAAGSDFERLGFRSPYALPGTQIRIELPLSIPTVKLAPRASSVDIDERPIEGLSREVRRNELYDVFSNTDQADPTRTPPKVIVLNLRNQQLTHEDTVDLFLDVAEMAHPAPTAVIGLGISDTAVFNAAADATDYIDSARNDQRVRGEMRTYEPFVCITSSFQVAHWIGMENSIGDLINTNPEGLPLDAIRRLSGYSLGRFDAAGDWEPVLAGDTLWQSAKKMLDESIDHWSTSRPGTSYISPSLVASDTALDLVSSIRNSKVSNQLIALMLTSQLATEVRDLVPRRLSLLFDDLVDQDAARAVASCLQGGVASRNSYQRVRPHDIEVSRDLGLDRSREVVVLVGMIASEQTARQLIALALRQGYSVVAVLAVVDMRAVRLSAIEVWKVSFTVSAVFQRGSAPDSSADTAYDVVFVNNRGVTEVPFEPIDIGVSTGDIIDGLGRSKALYLGHFSGSVDRHFTFYVDAARALSDANCRELILSPLTESIREWIARHPGVQFIFYPSSERRQDAPAERLAQAVSIWLREHCDMDIPAVANDTALNEQKEVVHVAWGSLSGASIMDDIQSYHRRRVQSLLYIVLFSQGSMRLERHLASIRSVALDEFAMNLEVRFLARLPVDTFPQETCPVCYQLASRGRWIHDSYALGYAEEEERLAVDTWRPEPQARVRTDSVSEKYASSLPVELNASALHRRNELVIAQRSVREAYECGQDIATELARPQSEWVFGLITLLVYEPQWLRRPPLSQTDLRFQLAEHCRSLLDSASEEGAQRDIVAKALICLRVVSKVYFSEHIADVLMAVRDDAELFDLGIYMVATVLTRDYLASTGLPSAIAGGLATARARLEKLEPLPHDQIQATSGLHDRATQLRLVSRIRSVPRWESLQALDSRLLEFPRHLVAGAFQRGLPGRWGGLAMEHLGDMLSEWAAIRQWLRENLIQYIVLFMPLFRHTSALCNYPDLTKILPRTDGRDAIEDIISGLRMSLKDPQHFSKNLKKSMYSVHHIIGELLAPETGTGLLMTAIRQTRVPVSRIADVFADECWREGVGFNFDEERFGDIQVLMPNRFLTVLSMNLVANAVANVNDESRMEGVEITLSVLVDEVGDDDRVTLEFTHRNTRPKPRVEGKKGPGGLVELESMCAEFINVEWTRRLTEMPFTVWVRLDIGMRGMNDEI